MHYLSVKSAVIKNYTGFHLFVCTALYLEL